MNIFIMNKKSVLIWVVVLIAIAAGSLVAYFKLIRPQLEVIEHQYEGKIQAQRSESSSGSAALVYDPNNVREVAGFFTDIFVARITERKGADEIEGFARTLYTAEVIGALKGNLTGTVVVSQMGGFSDGQWIIWRGDEILAAKSSDDDMLKDYFLEPEKIYLLLTRPSKDGKQYNIGLATDARTLLGVDSSLSNERVADAISKNEVIERMKKAIVNQILPKAKAKP